MKDSVNKTLEDMRKITMLTGQLSSVHEQNLQTWPYIAFESVENAEIDYDLSKAYFEEVGQNRIEFNLKIAQSQEQVENRCKCLASWVRDMFWKEIAVTVKINGAKVYHHDYKTKSK